MDERPKRRFKIWDVGGDRQFETERLTGREPLFEGPALPVGQPSFRQGGRNGKLAQTPLAEVPALYDYRPLIDLELDGACRLSKGGSIKCKSKAINSETAAITYDVDSTGLPEKSVDAALTGSKAHLDLDHIGSFHGIVTSQDPGGFSVSIDEAFRSSLRRKLSKITAERGIAFDEAPRKLNVTRIEPETKNCIFEDHTRALRKGRVVNISQIDTLIKSAIVPPRDSHVIFRGRRRYLAKVTRTFEIGFAASFCVPIPEDEFSAAVKFLDE